jgi:hypothetical protein
MTYQKPCSTGYQWLTPIILTTQDTEIRRIMVGSQPGQIVLKTLFEKTLKKKGGAWWIVSRCRP